MLVMKYLKKKTERQHDSNLQNEWFYTTKFTQKIEQVKLFITYTPVVKQKLIRQRAKVLKMERLDAMSEDQKKKVMHDKKLQRMSSMKMKKEEKKEKVDDNEVFMQEAKNQLITRIETRKTEIVITGRIQLQLFKDVNKHPVIELEELECHVLCTEVRPDIFMTMPTRTVDFGTVAVGSRSTFNIDVKNISYDTVYLHTSCLQPIGPFSCPIQKLPMDLCGGYGNNWNEMKKKRRWGVPIEPEEYYRISIHYIPTSPEERDWERLEVKGGRTSIDLQILGRSVESGINLAPDITLYQLEAAYGGTAVANLTVSSTSQAEQSILISQDYMKVVSIADVQLELEDKNESPKEKKSSGGGRQEKKDPHISATLKGFFDGYESVSGVTVERSMISLKSAPTKGSPPPAASGMRIAPTPEFRPDDELMLSPNQKFGLLLRFALPPKRDNVSDKVSPPKTGSQDTFKSSEPVEVHEQFSERSIDKEFMYVTRFSFLLGGVTPLAVIYCTGKFKDKGR